MRRTESLLLPIYAVLFFAFLLAPILVVVVISFQSADYVAFPIEGFSTRWFVRVAEYPPFRDALVVSLEIAVLSAALASLIGVPAALALARARTGWADALTTFLLSPLSIPLIVLGYAMLFWFSALGLGVSFLSLLLAHTVVGLPYVLRTVVGVYRGLAPALEENAAILGATPLQAFRRVTLPLIRPGIFGGALLAALISLDNLPVSYFFGSASTNTLPVVMLSYLETSFDPSVAALSTVQLLLAVIALLVCERLFGLTRLANAL